MKRPSLSVRTLGRAAMRGALAAIALSALFLVGLLSPGDTESAGPFNVNDEVTKIRIDYTGGCNPGNLKTQIPSSGGIGTIVSVSGDIYECLGTETIPFALRIDDELIGFANVNTTTTMDIDTSDPPVYLEVEDCAEFPSAPAYIYVNGEYMRYASKSCGGTRKYLQIDQRGLIRPGPPEEQTEKAAHSEGSFVRAQGRLKVVERGLPTYNSRGLGGGETGVVKHSPGPSVSASSPTIQLTCRQRLKQEEVTSDPDDVTLRSRCYARLEPDGPWLDAPNPIEPVLPMAPFFYHDISSGTIDDAGSGNMALTTGIEGYDCLPYVDGRLWVKVTLETTVTSKSPSPPDEFPGRFRINVWFSDSDCETTPDYVIGENDEIDSQGLGQNLKVTVLEEDEDTDGDGCTDYEELGADVLKGGLRDPYNPYDYYDVGTGPSDPPNHNPDGYVDLFNDILSVIAGYTAGGGTYEARLDRGPPQDLGPSHWNRPEPDGTIDLFNDILGVISQYQHDCRSAPNPP